MKTPDWLPPAHVVRIEGRGEVFARVHRHPDPEAPVLLLLHGWTATADTQWAFAYQALAERYSFVAVDHHGHGRGLRLREPFDLAKVAADAVMTARTLGFDQVVTVGYSMGGPVSLHLWRDHPEMVTGMVLAATALEWRDTLSERMRWHAGRLLRPAIRAWWYPRMLRRALRRWGRDNPDLEQWVDWIASETLRNDPFTIAGAGTALSRYDAREWAESITVPTAMVLTTKDRLVKPGKQRTLAEAMKARVFEVEADHLCSMVNPDEFAVALRSALDHVTRARIA